MRNNTRPGMILNIHLVDLQSWDEAQKCVRKELKGSESETPGMMEAFILVIYSSGGGQGEGNIEKTSKFKNLLKLN